MGLTRSGVIEVAIRQLAKEQGLPSGYLTSAELDAKWSAFMEEDEAARSAELEQKRAEASSLSERLRLS
jgi:antitoxin component of RelBE/YafQ-DinJ toxin-antitoxin module